MAHPADHRPRRSESHVRDSSTRTSPRGPSWSTKPPTNIMLFAFHFSARMGGPLRDDDDDGGGGSLYWENRNDVKGLVWTPCEIVTRDDPFSRGASRGTSCG